MVRTCAINPYIELMYGEFSKWTFAEDSPEMLGQWRQKVFSASAQAPMGLEIGEGNGYHFADRVQKEPQRFLLGLELKYKPLIQTIRRCLRQGSENGRMLRFDASQVTEIFAENEIDDVYIHHPDPWPKKRHLKNRLIQPPFLRDLAQVMKPGAALEFQTDHYGYFLWAAQCFAKSTFSVQYYTEDLHGSHRASKNYVTQFEKLFLQKGQPIYYCRLINDI